MKHLLTRRVRIVRAVMCSSLSKEKKDLKIKRAFILCNNKTTLCVVVEANSPNVYKEH
jgi:hypothetical protein